MWLSSFVCWFHSTNSNRSVQILTPVIDYVSFRLTRNIHSTVILTSFFLVSKEGSLWQLMERKMQRLNWIGMTRASVFLWYHKPLTLLISPHNPIEYIVFLTGVNFSFRLPFWTRSSENRKYWISISKSDGFSFYCFGKSFVGFNSAF